MKYIEALKNKVKKLLPNWVVFVFKWREIYVLGIKRDNVYRAWGFKNRKESIMVLDYFKNMFPERLK